MSDSHELDRSATSTLLPERSDGDDPAELSADLARLRELLERQDLAGARAWVDQLQQQWPDSDRVQHFSRILTRPAVTLQREQPKRSRDLEYRWLRDHADEHPACWLAALGGELRAADPHYSGGLVSGKTLTR